MISLGDIPDLPGAVCAQTDPDHFFPRAGGHPAAAKRFCLMCPVRTECLEWALRHNEEFGIWGGLSTGERRRLRLAREKAA